MSQKPTVQSADKLKAYLHSVNCSLSGLNFVSTGPCPGCLQCAKDYGYNSLGAFYAAWRNGDLVSDMSFSRSPCDICGTPLGGDREVWHWVDDDNVIQHENNACVDCVRYLANEDLPAFDD